MNSGIREKVKEFVRDKMSCKCPDEVFEHVEVEKEVKIGKFEVDYRINVGNRLLIYVVNGEKYGMEENVRNIVKEGLKERDERKFNRFRLVLVGEENLELLKIAEEFERAHIHFLKKIVDL